MLNQLKGVFRSLEDNKVRYVVIGGIAAILHGVPRATFDLDILIDPDSENSQRLLDALLDSGLGTAALITNTELLANEITIFQDRIRIDVQTRTPGITFEKAWKNREIVEYQGQKLYLVSKDDLIASKKAAGRSVDLEDIRLLTLDDSE